MSNVVPLGVKRTGGELEGALIGALLDLEDKVKLFDMMGLTKTDFQDARYGVAFTIIRTLALRRRPASAMTVVSAGVSTQLLNESDLDWLQALEANNTLTEQQALVVGEDLRARSKAKAIHVALLHQADLIARGRFIPAQLGAALDTISHGLATDFAVDESADRAVFELNESWESNEKKGKATLRPTGITVLDSIIGGLPENLWFLHGKPGAGKNAILSTMIYAQLVANPTMKIGAFLMEDGVSGLLRRWQALALDMPLREVGWKVLPPEKQELKAEVDAHHHELLKRLIVYQHDSITRAELIRRLRRMIYNDMIDAAYIDNMKEIDHTDHRQPRQEHWQAMGETTRQLRNTARDAGVPIGVLIHDTEETAKPGHEGPPDPRKMSGGQAGGDKARLILGAWRKEQALRITVTKGNEISDAGINGPTVELERHFEAAMVSATGGRKLDLKAEAARERRDAKASSREEAVAENLARAALKKKMQGKTETPPPEQPKPPAQATLLDVPQVEKP